MSDIINSVISGVPLALKDPFQKDMVDAIHIHMYPHADYRDSCSATIEFKNGKTEGKQKFAAADFESLMYQVKIFIDQL